MRNITFIGSTNSSYARGKDKKKRKSRGLLTAGISALGAGIGGKIGGELAKTGVVVNKMKKKVLKKDPNFKITPLGKIKAHINSKNLIKEIEVSKPRYSKVFNTAKKIGGIRGAAIGAGLGLGGTLLVNKIKNKKKK